MDITTHKILLIDADVDLLLNLKATLASEKFHILTAINSTQAIQIAKDEKPDLIVLEMLMPEMDGVEICFELKKTDELKNTLIIFYTQRNEDYSQIVAFEAGADDYIIKPTKPRVLISRLNALLKRHSKLKSKNQKIKKNFTKGLVIDRERYLIFKDGKEIILPRKEFELLSLMYSTPKKVFTRKEIMNLIWGYDFLEKNRTVDVHIRKLRKKIGNTYIKSIKGVGYSLEI